jgi:hypothetical protein
MINSPDEYRVTRESHYERFLGPLTEKILHSTDVKPVHIDIYQFAPTEKRPYWTLVTGGMSDQEQTVQDDTQELTSVRTELLMYVKEPKPWMFNVLKGLAEMPFDDDTHLSWWHTVPNGQPMTAEPSLLTSFFFLPPYFEGAEFDSLELDGEPVRILWMIPITEAEREYAVKHSSNSLEELMVKQELDIVVNEKRSSLV